MLVCVSSVDQCICLGVLLPAICSDSRGSQYCVVQPCCITMLDALHPSLPFPLPPSSLPAGPNSSAASLWPSAGWPASRPA